MNILMTCRYCRKKYYAESKAVLYKDFSFCSNFCKEKIYLPKQTIWQRIKSFFGG